MKLEMQRIKLEGSKEEGESINIQQNILENPPQDTGSVTGDRRVELDLDMGLMKLDEQ